MDIKQFLDSTYLKTPTQAGLSFEENKKIADSLLKIKQKEDDKKDLKKEEEDKKDDKKEGYKKVDKKGEKIININR
mgnify:CR=1 FL=1